jgi:hypothetical protein
MFCATQVCTKYDSIRVATWLHNFSLVLRAAVFVSLILNMTSEACVAIILTLECSPEKAKKRCFYINDWIPIDTCCATSPLKCKLVTQKPCCTKNIRKVLILCNRLCELSISTIHGQPVAQHAMLHDMIDPEWAP